MDESVFRCRMLQQEIDNSGRRVESLEADISRMRSEKMAMMASVTTATREAEDFRAALSIASSERDSMKNTIESLRKEMERLQAELHLKSRQLQTQPTSAPSAVGLNTGSSDENALKVERSLREALSQSESLCAQLQVLICTSEV